ncbi:unnamed protein product [Mytilus coruscus]|uniref:Uncharacterized protein n=1 Tax=Mytilus coruscus TaxID=42192 RepID=A0A6J8C9F1_MYTCO|nr:unnamed protein product [Mytilus coruscus]
MKYFLVWGSDIPSSVNILVTEYVELNSTIHCTIKESTPMKCIPETNEISYISKENKSFGIQPILHLSPDDYVLTCSTRKNSDESKTSKKRFEWKSYDEGNNFIQELCKKLAYKRANYIYDHKTSQQGPVMIALSAEIFAMLKNFIAVCKTLPGFTPDDKRICWTHLMTKESGNGDSSNQFTATHVRAACPESRTFLAKHMTHSPRTADQYYSLHNQREMAIPVTNLIASDTENRFSPGINEISAHWPTNKINIPQIENSQDENQNSRDENQIIQTSSLWPTNILQIENSQDNQKVKKSNKKMEIIT